MRKHARRDPERALVAAAVNGVCEHGSGFNSRVALSATFWAETRKPVEKRNAPVENIARGVPFVRRGGEDDQCTLGWRREILTERHDLKVGQ